MRQAGIYKRLKDYFLCPISESTEGAPICSEPYVRVPIDSNEEIGKTVCSVLDASTIGIPHPSNWDVLVKPFIRLANVKSFRQFERNAHYCQIDDDDVTLSITAWRRIEGGGFEMTDENPIVLASGSSFLEITEALERAFALCKD